jgi:hypothetical protein
MLEKVVHDGLNDRLKPTDVVARPDLVKIDSPDAQDHR